MNSVSSETKQKHLKTASILFLDFVAIPFVLYVFLALPRIYAVLTYSNWDQQFSTSYVDLNLNLAYLIAALYFILKHFNVRLARTITALFLFFILTIRIIDIKMIRIFRYSYSPQFFGHLELESFRVFINQYWWLLFLYCLAWIGAGWGFLRLPFQTVYSKKMKTIGSIVFCLFFARSVFIMKNQSWHSSVDFASQLFVEQVFAYYRESSLLEQISWSDEEVNVIQGLGFDLEIKQIRSNQNKNKKNNLIIVYLEGFQDDYTALGGSPYKGLTPNLDRFAQENIYFENFYNAVFPTINVLISSQCSLLPQFDNHSLDQFIYAPNIPCLSDYLYQSGYRQVILQGTNPGFSGTRKFAEYHEFDQVIGKDDILKSVPELKSRLSSWGVSDPDLFMFAEEVITDLIKNRPFHLSLFTIDTHPPFDTSAECPVYRSNKKKLNAIHCVDYAFGRFLEFLKSQKLLSDTVVLVTGDHMTHGSNVFGKVFTALHIPGRKNSPATKFSAYTPDIAPTLLDILGAGIVSLQMGKSLLGERAKYQHLVARQFEIVNGSYFGISKCEVNNLKQAIIQISETSYNSCNHKKIVSYLDRWVLSKIK